MYLFLLIIQKSWLKCVRLDKDNEVLKNANPKSFSTFRVRRIGRSLEQSAQMRIISGKSCWFL